MTDDPSAAARIDALLAGLPPAQRAAMQELRAAIAAAAPEAEEAISYSMPAFRYHGRALVSYSAFKAHCSLFPMSAELIERNPDLARFAASKGTLHFTPEQPLPSGLVAWVVRQRMAQIDARSTRATGPSSRPGRSR